MKKCVVFIFSSTKLCASIADLISTWSVAQTTSWSPCRCPSAPVPLVPLCLPRCSANQRAAPWVFVSRFRWGLLFVEVVWRSSRRLVVSSSRCLLSCLFSSLKNSKPNLFWSKFWSMILLWLSVQTVQILSNHQIINSSFIVHHVLCRSAMRFQS